MTNFSITAVIKCCLDGVISGGLFYRRGCNFHPWWAPEYILSTFVYRKLVLKKWPHFIDTEASTRSAIRDCNGMRRGRFVKTIPKQSRTDIVIRTQKEGVKLLIEVKGNVSSFSQIRKDINRISSAISGDYNLARCGVVTFCSSAKLSGRGRGIATLENRLEKFQAKLNKLKRTVAIVHLSEPHKVADFSDESQHWVWIAVAIVLYKGE